MQKWLKEGKLPKVKYADILTFSILAAILLHFYRCQNAERDIIYSALKLIIGKEESFQGKIHVEDVKRPNLTFTLNVIRSLNIFFGQRKSKVCPHPNLTCIKYCAKVKSFIL